MKLWKPEANTVFIGCLIIFVAAGVVMWHQQSIRVVPAVAMTAALSKIVPVVWNWMTGTRKDR
jgi:hypothetical protein